MRNKWLTTLSEAVSWIEDGMIVGIGEFSYQNPPMTVVHEIIRQGKKDLTIVSGPTSGLATDMLIGAGCVQKVVTAGVAFEQVAGIAPAFRRACEDGNLDVWECDECMWHVALKAGAWGIPFILWQGGIGSDIPLLNPEIKLVRVAQDGQETIEDYKWQNAKFQTERDKLYLKVPAISPDITFVHAAWADELGFVQYPKERFMGRIFSERVLAEATRGPVIATVEKIVDSAEIQLSPELTVIRDAFIIEAPQGAKPGGCNGVYPPDLDAYRQYEEEYVKSV